MTQSKLGLIAVFITLLILGACASGPEAPDTLLSQAESSVRQAESADADEHAPVALREAKKNLSAAKSHIAKENYEMAKRLLEKTIADADFATAKSNAEKSQRAADEVRENLEVLEREVNNRQRQ